MTWWNGSVREQADGTRPAPIATLSESVCIDMMAWTANAESPISLPIWRGGFEAVGAARLRKLATRLGGAAGAVLFSMLLPSLRCQAADIVFVRSAVSSLAPQQELEIATSFYGLGLQVVTVTADEDNHVLARAVEGNDTLGVAVAADALALVDEKALLQAMSRKSGAGLPLLILGVTPEIDQTLLRAWSGGAAAGCRWQRNPAHPHYVVHRAAGLTGQLAELELAMPSEDTSHFVLGDHLKGQIISEVRYAQQALPVFIATALDHHNLFLVSQTPSPTNGGTGTADSVTTRFATIAPAMMFIRYCSGERGWHALHHYANLTIDDAWLTEPYGNLNYRGLLGEMERHNFHTTIAFIPWNYDRSEPEVAGLVRSRPERFSICVHGDNHDHQEFSDLRSKPLPVQVAALREALARMDRFQTLTRIPYDKVMVFPHSIGSERILEALKTYNYLATVNSSNVPMDVFQPPVFWEALRSFTLSWGDFPSIARYPVAAGAEGPTDLIAINEFLDNPLLFYGHHDLFENGISAFDAQADQLNKLEPDTQWSSLGDIVRHLYRVRLRDDSNHDVLAFSSNLSLENTSGHDSIFYVRKQETGSPLITSVSVDGRPSEYQLHDGYLDLSVEIPAGKTRNVVVLYENDGGLMPASASKHSLRVYLLRRISDFRDITLSKYAAGRALTHLYYSTQPTSLLIFGALAMILACGCGGWGLRLFLRRRIRLDRARTRRTVPSNRQNDGPAPDSHPAWPECEHTPVRPTRPGG